MRSTDVDGQLDGRFEVLVGEVLAEEGLGHPRVVGIASLTHRYFSVGNLGIPLMESPLKKYS